MEIIDYIPRGKENAITRHELSKQSGLRDRVMRDDIMAARYAVPIISSGKGYYKPTCVTDVIKWVDQEMHRAFSVFRALRGAKEYILAHAGEIPDEYIAKRTWLKKLLKRRQSNG